MSGDAPAAHMVSMTHVSEIDAIISSTGLTREYLDDEVAEWRGMSLRMESVQADHFNVEELAAAVEHLAFRLAQIQNIAGEHAHSEGDLGELGRRIVDIAAQKAPNAAAMVPPFENEKGQFSLYGHPDLLRVREARVDMESRRIVSTDHIVHPASGAYTPVSAIEGIDGACLRLKAILA